MVDQAGEDKRYCVSCGEPIDLGARFCAKCGAPQHHADIVAEVSRSRRLSNPTIPEPSARDFTSAAVITMLLYFVLYVPGLIANFAYLSSADAEKERLGREPEGRGCLVGLLWAFLGVPLIIVGIVTVLAIIGAIIGGVTSTPRPAPVTTSALPTPPPTRGPNVILPGTRAPATPSTCPPPLAVPSTIPGLPPLPAAAKTVTAPSGLQYIDVVTGAGPAAQPGQFATVQYTGWLLNGTKFDSSVDRNQPFTFPLGAGQVIKGWDEGVANMRVGGQRRLIIPSSLGYGDKGAGGGVIPPCATLVFDIQLVGLK